MTVEQLEIVITANSDDLDAKLAAVNAQLAELEKNAESALSAVSFANLEIETQAFNPQLSLNNSETDFNQRTEQTAALLKTEDAEQAIKTGVSAANINKTVTTDYDYKKQDLNISDYYSVSASGITTAGLNMLLSGASQSNNVKKASEALNDENTTINMQVTVEVDGDVLAETVTKNQIKKIIRGNGMIE